MTDDDVDLRPRRQLAPAVIVIAIVAMTLGSAAANLLPTNRPDRAQLRREETRAIIDARRQTIAALTAVGDQCRPVVAHELARALVFDGRSARAYADDYTQRCGDDLVMEHWGNAPMPPLTRRR
jgi:hypothetical protein